MTYRVNKCPTLESLSNIETVLGGRNTEYCHTPIPLMKMEQYE